ncbi:YcaO-like family protein [Devosia sp.]|uniref:YcaO-like family protein n=1 Tax=Devosia sp. TaxID=1871048 RepID=UPI003BAC25ED
MHFETLGITRLAGQTGLDRLGIPCVAAIRPNSATVATHQGKGIDEASARISAVMEAAEYALAEVPDVATLTMTANSASLAGYARMSVAHLMPHTWTLDEEMPLDWLQGEAIGDPFPVLVPAEAIVLGRAPRQLIGISQSTNGLAAGTSRDGALLHALCELIERDAVCLWGFKSDAAAHATAVAPEAFADAEIDALVRRIATAGFRLNIYDQTTNTGVPCIYAVLSPDGRPDRHFDAATGAGCHPVPAIAARRAIVEAAQTRISIIAGSRDDIAEADYGGRLSRDVALLTAPGAIATRPAPTGLGRNTSLLAQLEFVKAGLAKAQLNRIIVVPLGGGRFGIHVLRAFVPGLEDRLTNKHWRPGPRATAAMLGFA